MIRIGEIIDGRYEILKEIGRGGMSIVYLAMDNRLNKSIVVKEIRRRNKEYTESASTNSTKVRLSAEKIVQSVNAGDRPRVNVLPFQRHGNPELS